MRTLLLVLSLLVATSASGADFDYGAYQMAKLSDVASSLDINPRGITGLPLNRPGFRRHLQAMIIGNDDYVCE